MGEQAFLPLLGMDTSLQGKPGRVLNMSSIYGSYALPFSVRCYVPSMFGRSPGYAVSHDSVNLCGEASQALSGGHKQCHCI